MLRCCECGGQAIPGLAHLHGDPCRPLCHDCTQKVLARMEQKLREERIKAEMADYIKRVLPKAA